MSEWLEKKALCYVWIYCQEKSRSIRWLKIHHVRWQTILSAAYSLYITHAAPFSPLSIAYAIAEMEFEWLECDAEGKQKSKKKTGKTIYWRNSQREIHQQMQDNFYVSLAQSSFLWFMHVCAHRCFKWFSAFLNLNYASEKMLIKYQDLEKNPPGY